MASKEKEEESQETSQKEKATPEQIEAFRMIGVVQADQLLRGQAADDIKKAQYLYDQAKAKLKSATTSGELENSKLEAEDAREALGKAKQEYETLIKEDKERIAEAKRILGDDFHEDEDDLMKERGGPYFVPPK